MIKLVLFLLLLLNSIGSYSQTYTSKILQLIKSQQYQQAFTYGKQQIKHLKDKNYRSTKLEFLTWTALSLCENPNGEKGCKLLGKYLALHKNTLSSTGNYGTFTKSHKDICIDNKKDVTGISSLSQINTALVHESEGSAGYTSDFKTYMYLSDAANLKLYFRNGFERIFRTEKPQKAIEINRTAFNSSISAVRKDSFDVMSYLKKVYPGRKYTIGTNFIIVSRKVGDDTIKVTLKLLEKTLQFYRNQFDLPAPAEYITVFLSDNSTKVDNDISAIYGVRLNSRVLGFSDISSYSMVAWIPAFDRIGTLKHELIHMLFRNQFIFVPEWIEEGIATLYEESRFQDSVLVGIGNWRGNLLLSLSKIDSTIPKALLNKLMLEGDVYQLPEMSAVWSKMSDARRQARNKMSTQGLRFNEREANKILDQFFTNFIAIADDAMSRYLMLYIQETGQLDKLIGLLRKNDDNALESFDVSEIKDLFIKANESVDYETFQTKFLSWLRKAPMDNR